eukprot:gb/GECH01012932.1/.p1 GENE.gb/GECH01012932.1/~~gb/GECH01012932.1/.p1  ORF type:complete len:852 (+),score=208.52 gb/GECH01012932.1/:1-2556(+)
MDITETLLNTHRQEEHIRSEATQRLEQLKKESLPMFLGKLVVELADESKPQDARQAAGLILKNTMTSKSDEMQEELSRQWINLEDQTKQQIKTTVMETLSSTSKQARHTAAQVLSRIAFIELPEKQWSELIPKLCSVITQPPSPELKEGAVVSLGYICEEIDDSEVLGNYSSEILTAVIEAMKDEDDSTKEAATTALNHILDIVSYNMENSEERNVIMTAIWEQTQASSYSVRVAAYQCFVTVAGLYYELLDEYIEHIHNITVSAVPNDEEEVGQQAVEFWSTIAEVEIDRLERLHEAHSLGEQPPEDAQVKGYTEKALDSFVPVLLQALTTQDNEEEDDEWNLSAAAGVCLEVFARVTGDAIVDKVMPFVTENIRHDDWNVRGAATLAFGSILEGPTTEKIGTLVNEAVGIMLEHMNDPVTVVKDSSAWTVGRISLFHPDPILENIENVLKAMVNSMSAEPNVADKACWTINNIALHYKDSQEESNPLSQYFETLVESLFNTTERPEVNVRISAYETLSTLLRAAASDVHQIVHRIVEHILDKLENLLSHTPQSSQENEERDLVIGLLCGALTTATAKLSDQISPYATRMMNIYSNIFGLSNTNVLEETLMAVGALANVMEEDFTQYMEYCYNPILSALQQYQADQACNIAVGVVSDLAYALKQQFLPFADKIMEILLQNLQRSEVNRVLKTTVISCLGDIALTIEKDFVKYLPQVANILLEAANHCQADPGNDLDYLEYLNMLKESILEAFTGIIQGIKDDRSQFQHFLEGLLGFLQFLSQDQTIDENVLKNAVAVIGDIANAFGGESRSFLSHQWVESFVSEALSHGNEEVREAGEVTKDILQAVFQS